MKGKLTIVILALCLLLTGCSLFQGSYIHVTPYLEQTGDVQSEMVSASSYRQLAAVLEDMVAQGRKSAVINVSGLHQNRVEGYMDNAIVYIRSLFPMGAYAVDAIEYELGSSNGRPAVAVTISYRHSQIEIQRVQAVHDMETARERIGIALDDREAGIVLEIEEYKKEDFSQIVEDYAELHPDTVMETPQVAAATYGTGTGKVVELTFTYQNSRDTLRNMQSQVRTVFDSAALYVSGNGTPRQKFSQLYGFLMERFEYTLRTSITPAYSLLNHGVGDSRAFAVVYAAMCRQAGLDCRIVTGTKDGDPWVWNMIRDNGYYFHVDLLRSSQSGGFRELIDTDMGGYVWDYTAYPKCVYVVRKDGDGLSTEATEPTEETQKPSEETVPPTEETTPPTGPSVPPTEPVVPPTEPTTPPVLPTDPTLPPQPTDPTQPTPEPPIPEDTAPAETRPTPGIPEGTEGLP